MTARRFTRLLVAAAVGATTLALAGPVSSARATPPDNTPPTVNVNVTAQPLVNTQLSTSNPASVPATIGWTQYDASGICSEYGSLYVFENDHWYYVTDFDNVQTSLQFTETVGDPYEIDIYATDCSANQNQSETERYIQPSSLSQEGAATYSAGWSTSNCTCFSGGTVLHSSKKGATASFTYTGYTVAWITEKASNRGTAQIYLDGVLKATVKCNNAAISSDVGAVRWSNIYGTHTLEIKVVSGRIDVDAFVVA